MKLSFARNGSPPEATAPAGYSVLDAQMFVRGDLSTEGTIRIDGRLEGNITKSDIVVIGSKATVTGNIVAREVVVAGSVEGNIAAESRVELDSSAVVVGDIVAGSILTHEGAQIRGKVAVRTGDAAQPSAAPDIGSEAAVQAASEAAAEAASLAEAVAARKEAPESWARPETEGGPSRPVRISPAEEEV